MRNEKIAKIYLPAESIEFTSESIYKCGKINFQSVV